MIYAAILTAASLGIILGGTVGFLLGRYIWRLLDERDALKALKDAPEPFKEAPTVTMGDYAPRQPISNMETEEKKFGIVETKTPELLEAERMESITKQVLGR